MYQKVTPLIHGKCYAEMKKGIELLYRHFLGQTWYYPRVAVWLCCWSRAEAHCMHVQTASWVLVCLSTTGDQTTEETCTQRLQPFHQTKKFTGYPAKSQNLDLGTEEDFDFDPRSTKYTNEKGYPDLLGTL